jgi:predicted DNA-binding transcriptional regulator AlpA
LETEMSDATKSAVADRIFDETVPPLRFTVDPASMRRLLDLFRDILDSTLAKALTKRPLSQEPTPEPAEPPSNPNSTGVELKPSDKPKAADVRTAMLLGKIPEDTGLLIDIKLFAHFLNISTRTLAHLQAEEAIPAPVHLGRLKRWRLAEILEWIEADCPPQRVWIQTRQESSKRKGKVTCQPSSAETSSSHLLGILSVAAFSCWILVLWPSSWAWRRRSYRNWSGRIAFHSLAIWAWAKRFGGACLSCSNGSKRAVRAGLNGSRYEGRADGVRPGDGET